MRDYITRENFAAVISGLSVDEAIKLGHEHGWLEPEDRLFHDGPTERRNAARIVHNYILRELHEADMADVSKASELKDLYDCHVCVNHIAQVYCRQIMLPARGKVFDLTARITCDEAKEIAERIHEMLRKTN